jgi:hypothetical protein
LRDPGSDIGSAHFPCDSQSYNAITVRFSAKVGEEPTIEVARQNRADGQAMARKIHPTP